MSGDLDAWPKGIDAQGAVHGHGMGALYRAVSRKLSIKVSPNSGVVGPADLEEQPENWSGKKSDKAPGSGRQICTI